jgi:hypothetical protein
VRYPHTHFKRGQRLRIVFRDGTVLVRRFVDRIGRFVVVADDLGLHEKLATNTLKNLSIFKKASTDRAVASQHTSEGSP